MEFEFKSLGSLRGELKVPADKSISHRAVILGSLAKGESVVHNISWGEDVKSTIRCMQQLGAEIVQDKEVTRIRGKGFDGLSEPKDVLNCGNSGTTMRLLAGVAAARPFLTVLTGDESLRRRPMARVVEPLSMMGAIICGRENSRLAPLVIRGGELRGIEYHLKVASAQVKSAILLAALDAEGETIIRENIISRDHTERMLLEMGANLERDQNEIRLRGPCELDGREWRVPGDISSAAFWLVAAAIVPGSEVLVRDVGVNPTRSGVLTVLKNMGAEIRLENYRTVGGEPVADILVKHSGLQPVEIGGSIIPSLIDEIPILAIAMAMASGTSAVSDAGELRTKESDRIAMIVSILNRMGVEAAETPDGFIVHGQGKIPGNCRLSAGGDHRIAMASAVSGLAAEMPVTVEDFNCVGISYPTFLQDLRHLTE
ncbi:MAG: 3-phosphoshikimate 1-carboxyvinyltransferase [Syntrophomonadaceae bacterium]|nr:3-phosphoshikimate 1-carboxyvinyltransferase [Syntrophomonadaceae bacterium]